MTAKRMPNDRGATRIANLCGWASLLPDAAPADGGGLPISEPPMLLSHPSASTYCPRERGATMLLTVTLIIIVAALVVSGTGELRALDQIGRAEFAAEAQAYSVAYAGLVDAFAWFRRQTAQPVSTFAPRLDLAAEPPLNETEDPAEGLMRTFEISPAVWGRYTVLPGQAGESFTDADGDGIYDLGEKFVDADGDGRRTTATGTRDVTEERGVSGNGTIWRIECLGRVYRWTDLNQPLGEGPNRILGTALLAT